MNQITWMLDRVPARTADDVYLQKTADTFDVSLWGCFMPLLVGARLVVATPDGHRDPVYLARNHCRARVTVTDFVPSMLDGLRRADASAGQCRRCATVFVIGEALPPETAAALRRDLAARRCTTSTARPRPPSTVTSLAGHRRRAGTVPIGVPQWNTQRVRAGFAAAAGAGRRRRVSCTSAGDQLARGYAARPDLTVGSFRRQPVRPPVSACTAPATWCAGASSTGRRCWSTSAAPTSR